MTWLQRRDDLLAGFRSQRPIDVMAFLGRWPFRATAAVDAAGLAAMIDELNLSEMWVGHLDSVFGFDTRTGNAELLHATGADPRLVAFPVLNPAAPGWSDEMAWLAAEGARGIRLTPGYHGYRLDDPRVADALVAARERALLPEVCVRLQDDRVAHPRYVVTQPGPADVAGLLRRIPGDAPVLLSGLRASEWRVIRSDLGDVWRGRVALDLWHVSMPVDSIADLCRRGLDDVFCYGSATPVQEAEATAIPLGCADITAAQRAAMCRANAAGLLDRAGARSGITVAGRNPSGHRPTAAPA